MKKSTLFTTVLALILVIGSFTSAFADTAVVTAGGEGTSAATLSAEATEFNVTVPTQLPITVDGDLVVTTASNAYIINNSAGAVIVTGVSVVPMNGWSCKSFATNMSNKKVGTKEFGFSINTMTTDDTGALTGTLATNFPSIEGASGVNPKLLLNYNVVVPAQKSALTDQTMANIVFTIGWDE